MPGGIIVQGPALPKVIREIVVCVCSLSDVHYVNVNVDSGPMGQECD